ncbi:efflux RND transporter periplasmic adaptor subunit [Colwellia sp. D2M02]|nr:efflux RND transporter periplasmic adaptor subunit [Colwellia sp. D2M02]
MAKQVRLSGLLIASLLALSGCEQVATINVKQETVELTVTTSAEVESKKTALISPPSVKRMWQYQIQQIIPENSEVKKGDLLVSFDSKKVSDLLIDKNAELKQAKQELENKTFQESANEKTLVLALAEMQMEFEKAKRRAEIIDNSRSVNDRKKSEIDFTIATNDLFLAKEKLKFHRTNTLLNLKIATAKVERLTAESAVLQRDIERLQVKAPMDGMVIYIANWQGEKPAKGESIQFGQPVIELAVADELQLKAQISEPDSGKIALGQKVKITIDSVQEQSFQGEIVKLASVFRDKSTRDKRRIFDTTIALDNNISADDIAAMRPGMVARVEIITQVIENALTLPISSIKTTNNQSSVTIINAFNQTEALIETSAVLEQKVVIKSGVTLGDTVAL